MAAGPAPPSGWAAPPPPAAMYPALEKGGPPPLGQAGPAVQVVTQAQPIQVITQAQPVQVVSQVQYVQVSLHLTLYTSCLLRDGLKLRVCTRDRRSDPGR